MSTTLDFPRAHRDGVTIPTIWIAVALSVLIHVLALWGSVPNLRRLLVDIPDKRESGGPLQVELMPPAGARAPIRLEPAPGATTPAIPAPRRAAPPPPVIARTKPLPETVPVTPAPAPEPPAITPPAATPAPSPPGDFASMVEARRRARTAAPSSPAPAPAEAEDDSARNNRIVAANLGLNRTPSFGPEQTSGGIFQIRRMGYTDAEFMFYGWNRDIRRNTAQLIEVRKGEHSDIRLAVVRRMIAIIREYETTDFVWESLRLGREVILSARLADNAGLEAFMLREFFPEMRGP